MTTAVSASLTDFNLTNAITPSKADNATTAPNPSTSFLAIVMDLTCVNLLAAP